jgi:hypothetical protein
MKKLIPLLALLAMTFSSPAQYAAKLLFTTTNSPTTTSNIFKSLVSNTAPAALNYPITNSDSRLGLLSGSNLVNSTISNSQIAAATIASNKLAFGVQPYSANLQNFAVNFNTSPGHIQAGAGNFVLGGETGSDRVETLADLKVGANLWAVGTYRGNGVYLTNIPINSITAPSAILTNGNIYLTGTILNASNATATFSGLVVATEYIANAIVTNLQLASVSNNYAYVDANGYIVVTNNGAWWTNLNATELRSGTVPVARLPAFSGGDVTSSAGSGVLTIGPNAVALGTDTTGSYVATVADAGASEISVTGSGSETAAVTLGINGVAASKINSGILPINRLGSTNGAANDWVWTYNNGTNKLAAQQGGANTNDSFVPWSYSLTNGITLHAVNPMAPTAGDYYQFGPVPTQEPSIRLYYNDRTEIMGSILKNHGSLFLLSGDQGNLYMEGFEFIGTNLSTINFGLEKSVLSVSNVIANVLTIAGPADFTGGANFGANSYITNAHFAGFTSGVVEIQSDGTMIPTNRLANLNTVVADGYGFSTNLWTTNSIVGMGTNYTAICSASTGGGITGIVPNSIAGNKEFSSRIVLKCTGDVTFTNPVAFVTSDGLDTRTFTNGNFYEIDIHWIPTFMTNMVFSWSK